MLTCPIHLFKAPLPWLSFPSFTFLQVKFHIPVQTSSTSKSPPPLCSQLCLFLWGPHFLVLLLPSDSCMVLTEFNRQTFHSIIHLYTKQPLHIFLSPLGFNNQARHLQTQSHTSHLTRWHLMEHWILVLLKSEDAKINFLFFLAPFPLPFKRICFQLYVPFW